MVVDVETAGFDAQTDALLEIAAIILNMDEHGDLYMEQTIACHVAPFPDAHLDERALAFNGIDPFHPFRDALPEAQALERIFQPVRAAVKKAGCTRAILVGHNAFFDVGFLNAAIARTNNKKSPFHQFSSLDTVTLAALAYGQTVLARAAQAAGLSWDENEAHSAIYDAERTAELFCTIVNRWHGLVAGG